MEQTTLPTGTSDPATLSESATAYLRIYPLVPTYSFDEPLTYLDVEDAGTEVGSLVEIPVGNAQRVGLVVERGGEQLAEGIDRAKLRPISKVLDVPTLPSELIDLAIWTAGASCSSRTRTLSLIVPPGFAAYARASRVPRKRTQLAVRPTGVQAELTSRAAAVLAAVPDRWTSVAELVEHCSTTRPTITKLVEAGVLEAEERPTAELVPLDASAQPTPRPPASADDVPHTIAVALTVEQQAAVAECLNPPSGNATLLVGITGSGKTEVYLEVIRQVVAGGRSAIVLVPEIALTPQTSRRFRDVFGERVEVIHSTLTASEREAAYRRIAEGQADIVVGPRSAVFAPVRNLGALIVDEEHDSSYKQESDPRYDARRVAFRRASDAGALLIYGSATPRPESWEGIHHKVFLRTRASGAQLAPVQLVDLRDHDDFPLSEPVRVALDATLRRGNKAIVLQNFRGYASALHCRDCGWVPRCTRCDISLTVHGRHGSGQTLSCHHCGYRAAVPTICPTCRSLQIARLGAGTERIEQDLSRSFDVPILRLDADTARRADGIAGVLTQFAQPGPAALVGTQMVAKGHDFPDVELAVVIDADAARAIPDFRAEERAFTLVAQLAGRAGRSPHTSEHARVLVQTWEPEASFLRLAREHDVDAFVDAELARRRELSYPPYSRLIRILVSSPDARQTQGWAGRVAVGLRGTELGDVLGPATLLRIANRERAHVLIKTHQAPDLVQRIRAFVARTTADRRKADVRMIVDVDPQSLL